MPHFVIDCSESILESHSEEQIIEQVHFVADSTDLFEEGDIKVRVNPFKKSMRWVIKKKILFMCSPILWKVEAQSKKQTYLKK